MTDDDRQNRTQFLLKMYEAAWGNITRTDDVIWKLYTAYTTLVIGTVVLSEKQLAIPFYGVVATLFITFVATTHSLSVNAWFLRNIVIISNLEASFLNAADYGTLIPPRWHPRDRRDNLPFWNQELPALLAILYPSSAVLVVWGYWKRMTPAEQKWSFLLGVILLLFVCWRALRLS